MTSEKFLALVKQKAIVKSKRGYAAEAVRQWLARNPEIEMRHLIDVMEAIWAKVDTSEPSPSS